MIKDLAVVEPSVRKRPYHWGGGAQHHRDWDWKLEAGGLPEKDEKEKYYVDFRGEPVWAVKKALTLGLSGPLRPSPGAEKKARDRELLAPDVTPKISWALRNQNFRPTCVAQAFVACMELMSEPKPNPEKNVEPDGICRKAPGGLVAQRFSVETIYQRMLRFANEEPKCKRPADWQPGFTRLRNARQVLEDDRPLCRTVPPGTDGMIPDRELGYYFRVAEYGCYPTPAKRDTALARLVHQELRDHRPVAIALDAYAPDGWPDIPNNWTRPSVLLSGRVEDPLPHERPVPGSGHAVCVVGFVPDGREHLGGYFIFRNSLGEDFGQAPPPTTPARGYGTISATHVQKHCWELLSLRLA